MYPAPQIIETEVWTKMPSDLHRTDQYSAWVEHRGAGTLHSFLEGPAFDREGNFFCVDLAHSRLFKVTPDGKWHIFAEYDGEPNGLKIHKDGRIFVADHHHGILVFDPKTGKHEVFRRGPREAFKGLNDLTFAMNGDLYVTDQGQSGFEDLTGAIYRIRADNGQMDLIYRGLAAPNGLVLNKTDAVLHVSETRTNQVKSMPLRPDRGGAPRTRIFLQLSGSPTGPDGMAMDEAENLVVVHAGFGTVWVFSAFGEPLYRIKSCAGMRTTNVAYGGPDRKTLYITEAEHGCILMAKMPTPGRVIYGLS
jgi:gluconolactonase